MKIGVLTFHWATNYGAVLQCLALQRYLEDMGHNVVVINYKPKVFDISVFDLFKLRSIRYPFLFCKHYLKESRLSNFRNQYLNLSPRFISQNQLRELNDFDALFSGSDQILNPYFTLNGEGIPTSAYFLNNMKCGRRIGYAVSFGCVDYPANALLYAKKWINNFDALSVRENSGIHIINQLMYSSQSIIVPDPTLLQGKSFFQQFVSSCIKDDYCYIYLLHGAKIQKSIFKTLNVKSRFCRNSEKVETWLSDIANAKFVITNSYHGMIMAILFNRQFVVITNEGIHSGMNDRFVTLLSILQLEDRLVRHDESDKIRTLLNNPIDWTMVNEKLLEFSAIGKEFISNCLHDESSMVE